MKKKEEYSPQYLLDHNTVLLFGEIDENMAARVVSQLLYLEAQGAEEIIMQIASPGGQVSAGWAIYDTMNYVTPPIATVGLGICASMGAFLLAAGTHGKRSVLPHCEVMIHQPLGRAEGQASDIMLAADHIRKTRDRLNHVLSENTGQPLEKIVRDTDRDNTMTAEEALAYGLIDFIIPCTNKAKKEDRLCLIK